MTEIEKLEAGLEYCYDDPEVEKRKEEAIIQCKEYNASSGIFDFEIIGLYDGYISNLKFNTCLNAFLHDMISGPDFYFTSLQENKLNDHVDYVKLFIAHFNDLDRDIRNFSSTYDGAYTVWEHLQKSRPLYVPA